MSYQFEATDDYFIAEKKIATLISFAKKEGEKGNDDNRMLFLKLGVVFLVTRFQVYVESILKEFNYKLTQTKKTNSELPIHLRLNAIKIRSESKPLNKELENPTTYNNQKLREIYSIISILGDWCNDTNAIHQEFEINTQFPLGKQGLNELKGLFKQVEGKDIFDNARFDINKLNEILGRRHDIVHEDKNMQLTEITLRGYKNFITKVVKYIDGYLKRIVI
ncbi:MAG: hypothetical protein HY096_00865 [Nitrospinae bacterium]|nr:hypothetical protein [Nitrospinota bacterium]